MLRTLLMCTLLLPAVAFARDWQVDAAASTLGFTGSYQGEAFTGRFKSFEAQIRYDAADLATARFDV
ncbi:MAG: YceI family protein, partial [Rhodanobacteraceae bacterium]|nr:YceI family protein [Rhodanobacteraceae bacterium]